MEQAGHEDARPANVYRIKDRWFLQYPGNSGVRNNPKFKTVVELVLQPFEQLRFIGYVTININCGLVNKGFTSIRIIRDCAGSYKRRNESAVSYPPNQSKYCNLPG